MTGVFYAIGEFFEKLFKIMPKLGAKPNWILFFIAVILILFWLFQLSKYNKISKDKEIPV